MELATFGDIVFKVDSQSVKTLSEYSRKGSSRWATHEIIGAEIKPDYLGAGQGEINFKIVLLLELGSSQRADADELWEMMNTGEVAALIIGGIPVGDGLWYIETLEEAECFINIRGEVQKIELTAILKEYF